MARRGRAADLRAAKERKQKKIAIVGGILLVAILAFQVPRTMKMLSGDEEPEETVAVETTPAAPAGGPVSLEPPTLAGNAGAPPPAATGRDGLGAEPAPLAAPGQLVSFSRFESKDPFTPQVAAGHVASEKPDRRGRPAEGKPGGSAAPPAAPQETVRAALISVNGVSETVVPGGSFPAAAPVFRLVALTKTTASIAIAGGSYADGAATVKLRRGETLTLMNTADGVRYELTLVSLIRGSAPVS